MTTTKFTSATVLALGAFFGGHGSAAAAVTVQHASACRPYLSAPSTGLTYGSGGLINSSGAAAVVICPVVRQGDVGQLGAWTYVNGFTPGVAKCTVWSYSSTGVYLGSASASSAANGGGFSLALFLTKAQMPPLSSQSVVCGVPANTHIFNFKSMY